jgi:UDP-N-acetylmuramate: L-alanyl-gamma-D-glutamyl-meso-diaminopimelate ligase
MGVHREALTSALADADLVLVHAPATLGWDAAVALSALEGRLGVFGAVGDIVDELGQRSRRGDHVVIMSNGGFEGIHERVIKSLGG